MLFRSPIVLGKPIPILCVEIDATGIPVVKKETVGRQGKDGHPARHRDCPGMFVRKLWRCSSACVRPRRTQNQITKRTQSDPLFSTRAENESQIPPTEAARLPCRRMYPGATGCNTIPNSDDVAPAAGRGARQPSNPKSDYETKPIRPFFSTKAQNAKFRRRSLAAAPPVRRVLRSA